MSIVKVKLRPLILVNFKLNAHIIPAYIKKRYLKLYYQNVVAVEYFHGSKISPVSCEREILSPWKRIPSGDSVHGVVDSELRAFEIQRLRFKGQK